MITGLLASAYGGVAARRRAWYARHPEAVRHLARPVVSVGNLRVGGTGKTPIVAAIARELVARGHRPSVLSRGYARRDALDGVTVVADGGRILAGVETAGDEPLMLARQLPGVAVLAGSDRYLSGRLAERQLGVTVHILDDGFQHVALARDADVIVVDESDLGDRVIPAGHLRERIEAARAADAVLAGDPVAARRVADALGIGEAFGVSRAIGGVPDRAAFAVAGIARPQRFLDGLTASGCRPVASMTFPDHHRYSRADVRRIATAARSAGAEVVVTTEKDRVRLPADADGLPIVSVALTVTLEPRFGEWLMTRIT